MDGKYRLVTRSDFDGLVCAVLLREIELVDEILFVHPKDMQDGKIEITRRDITTNLPYHPECYLAFDHHASEVIRRGFEEPDNQILDPRAPSASRVVYEYYGGRARFPRVAMSLIEAVDRADSARFTRDEILDPAGWTLVNFLMDARTGLGRFRDFRISNYQLMMQLIDECRTRSAEEILALPDVHERVEKYREHRQPAEEQIQRCATVRDNVVVLDLRDEDPIYVCNRFLIYALFPQCNVSVHVMWGLRKQNTVFAIGSSILNPIEEMNIGALCLEHGGGGHANAGTCQVDNDRSAAVLDELLAGLRRPTEVEMSTD